MLLGSTEVVEDSLNPPWITPVVIDYSFRNGTDIHEAQLIDTRLGVETLMGSISFTIAELVTSKGEFLFKKLELKDTDRAAKI